MSEATSVFAVVPVKHLVEAKSRLTPILDPGARAGLTLYMMGRVVAALRGAGVENVGVVSPDRIVLAEAQERGATALRQESRGLNPALEEGRSWAMERGAAAFLVLPADLPLLEPDDVWDLLGETDAEAPAPIVISPDQARAGTNALLLRPPDALPFAFGVGSYEAHLEAASERDLDVRICERPHLAFDLDIAGDLAHLEEREVRRP